MSLTDTPRANRLHIAFYGRRNAGKSSLINLMTNQNTALVSDYAGTTTDPVIKSMELSPLGPVAVIDTAGLDDVGELGALRIEKTREMMNRTDLALLVLRADSSDFSEEKKWADELAGHKVKTIGIINHCDRITPQEAEALRADLTEKFKMPFTAISAVDGECRAALLSAIINNAPTDFETPTLAGDLFAPGSTVLLVAPQDLQAPKGRLILPQVQIIRDILDRGGMPFVCTADRLNDALAALKGNPDLVITDSQVFAKVNAALPSEVPLTSFSIILARSKGDLSIFIKGAHAIDKLKPTDKILVAEACTHAPLAEDIGRVKIPRMLRKKYGETLGVDVATGLDFPKNLREYALILHCGGCMFTRKQLMSRIVEATEAQIPITNYGLAIAKINGILDRAVEIFKN